MSPKRIILFLFFLIFLCSGCAASEALPEISVTFFDLGKADGILIRTPESAVLIDAGTNKNGKELVKALSALGISRLDALIITHFDKDHAGGADHIIDAFSPRVVLEPEYEKDGKQVEQYREALQSAQVVPLSLSENTSFSLGGVSYKIDVANQSYYGEDEENDFSLIVRMQYGSTSFLFAGDAEKPRLNELLLEGNLSADVLKVPHHGKYEDNSPVFFSAVSPRYAVITSSEEEPEDAQTLLALQQSGAEVLLTRMGTVSIYADGVSLRVLQSAP